LGRIDEAKKTYQEILEEKSLEDKWKNEASRRLKRLEGE